MAKKSYSLAVHEWLEKVARRERVVVQKLTLDIGTRLVMRSPVGNPSLWKNKAPKGYVGGRFRNNWYVSIGTKSNEINQLPDKNGAGSLSRIASVSAQAEAGHVIYFSNNLPYAYKIEVGHSKQAPSGVVGITAAEYRVLLSKAVSEARNVD